MIIKGVVIPGGEQGRKRGFPTANIKIEKQYPFLREGVYAAWITLKGRKYMGAFAAQIKKKKIQAFLIDYTGPDFLGEELTIDLMEQISQMESFETENELIEKITSDVEITKKILLLEV